MSYPLRGQVAGYLPKNRGLPFQRSYTKLDHQAIENCLAIIQDPRGIIYVGNDQGVLEFDGIHWNLIQTPDQGRIQSLCIDQIPEISTKDRPINRIYAGSSGDIGYLAVDSTGSLRYNSLKGLVPEEHRNFSLVHRTVAVNDGIVFQTGNYLFLYQNGQIKVIQPSISTTVFHFAHSLNGELYVTESESGPWRLNNGQLELVDGSDIFSGTFIMDLVSISENDGLILTYSKGLFVVDKDGFRPWAAPANDFLKKQDCIELARNDRNGHLVVQTMSNGMFLANAEGNIISTFNDANGRGGFFNADFIFDDLGNLWCATEVGVTILELSSPFSQFDEHAGLTGLGKKGVRFLDDLFVITDKDVNHRSWVPARNNLDKDWKFRTVNLSKTFPINIFSTGSDLFVSFLDGLIALDSSWKVKMNENDAGRVYKMIRLQESKRHVLGISSYGLVLVENIAAAEAESEWVLRKRFEEIQGDFLELEEGPAGTFWVSRPSGGFWKFGLDPDFNDLTDLQVYGTEHGLPAGAVSRVYKVDEEIVFATMNGLFRYQEATDKFYPDTTFNRALQGKESIHNLQEDQEGNIWVWSSAPGGNSDQNLRSLQLLKAEKTTRAHTHYTVENQLFLKVRKSLLKNLIVSPLEEGDALFSSENGVIHFDAHINFNKTASFKALIRQVEMIKPRDSTLFGGSHANEFGVPDTSTSIDHTGVIPFRNNGLRFTCTASYPINPSDLRFKFFLEGNDENWSEWTPEPKKEYSNLAKGTYTFHVKAQNVFETQSSVSKYTFTIAPPWYQTIAAFAAYGLFGIGLIWGIVKFNTRRLTKDKERLERTVEERTLELRETNKKLVEMDDFKQGLTSMIVHDLKNPLNTILNAPGPGGTEEQVRMIQNSGRQMLNMVMNILDVNKYEENKMVTDLGAQSLVALVEDAVESMKFLSQQRSISINMELNSCPRVLADPEILKRIMINLLTNAVKYVPVGGSVQIVCEAADGNMVRVSVTDNGEGIPANEIDKVFQKFGQVVAKKSGSIRSTGLGLTFCKMAVEAHGGKIGVESEPGRGSTFWFTLKRGDESDEITEIPVEKKKKPAEPEPTKVAIQNLREVANRLQSIPVYKISKIRAVLKAVQDQTPSQGTGAWLEEIQTAVNTGDQTRYNALINLVLHESA